MAAHGVRHFLSIWARKIQGALALGRRSNPKAAPHLSEQDRRLAELSHLSTQKELDKNYRLLRAILDGNPGPINVVGLDGRIQSANAAYRDLTKKDLSQIIGKTLREVTSEEVARDSERENQLVISSRSPIFMERTVTLNGVTRTYLINRFPIFDQDGSVVSVCAIGTDIYHQIKLREQLEETNRRLLDEKQKADNLLAALDQSAVFEISDVHGKIKRVNDRFCELSGYSREELLEKDHRILNSGMHSPAFFEEMWKKILSGKVWTGDIRNRRKDGGYYWLSTTIIPQKDSSGKIQEFITIRFDITQQKEIENKLFSVANSVPAVIAQYNRNLCLEFANQAYFDWWNITEASLNVQHMPELLGEELFEKNRRYIDAVLAGITQRFEREVVRRCDGAHRKTIISYLPDRVRDEVRGFFVYVQDITELKTAEEKAREGEEKARKGEEKAREAAQIKSEFLANMSHEIRTPLNGILGMADLIAETPISAEQKKYVSIIQQSGNALLSIVNDVLDFSKIESGRLQFEKVEFSISGIVKAQIDLLSPRAEQTGISLQSFVNPSLLDRRLGDPGKLGQIILNLVGNAIKFTKSGGVVVNVFLPRGTDDFIVRFEVTDTGIGILPVQKEKLFQPFTQADGSTARKYGGTGLGLSISKQIVEGMGGRIGLESQIGIGSTFWFEIPLPHSEFQLSSVVAPAPVAQKKGDSPYGILVAEDVAVNQLLVVKLLERLGHTVSVASNGREVLRALEKQRFDLILMDCQMPDMDGYEATRQIRQSKDPAIRSIPIVALTANALFGDKDKCKEAGMDDYLAKPVKRPQLEEKIRYWLEIANRKKDTGSAA